MGIRQFFLRRQFMAGFNKRQHSVQCAGRLAVSALLFAVVSAAEVAMREHILGALFGVTACLEGYVAFRKYRLARGARP